MLYGYNDYILLKSLLNIRYYVYNIPYALTFG